MGVIKVPTIKNYMRFTLLELLVVISIIVVLVNILLPCLVKARQSGKRISCANSERQVGFCFSSYADDYNGNMCPGYIKWHSWDWLLYTNTYLKPITLIGCPADDIVRTDPTVAKRSYRSNRNVTPNLAAGDAMVRVVEIKKPSTCFILFEYPNAACYYDSGSGPCMSDPGTTWYYDIVPVHSKGSNMLYCDGHSEFYIDHSLKLWGKYFDKE